MLKRFAPLLFAFLLAVGVWYVTLLGAMDLYQSDFRVFYSSGKIFRQNPVGMYDSQLQAQTQAQYFPIKKNEDHSILSFVNPPYVALFYSPLSFFNPQTAYRLYLLVMSVLFVLTLRLLIEAFGRNWSQRTRLAFILFTLSFAPLFVTLAMGQFSIFSLFLVIAGIRYLTRHEEKKAGLTWGALIFKPQLLLLWLCLLPTSQKILWGLGASMVFFTGVSVLLLGSSIAAFLNSFFSYVQTTTPQHSKVAMLSWQGFFVQLQLLSSQVFSLPISNRAVFGLTLLFSIGTVFGFRWMSRKQKMDPVQLVCTAIPLLLLSAFHVHVHDALLLLIPTAYLWGKPGWKTHLLIGWVWICFFFAYFSPFFPYPFVFFPHATLLLLAWACIRIRRAL